jgi:hypothetical protein
MLDKTFVPQYFQDMKPILQKDIPALSGKSREELAAIVCPLLETDSRLKFYRKIFIGVFIFTPVFMSTFVDSHVTLTVRLSIIILIILATSAFLQLFCINPRLKDILAGGSE